MEEEEEGEGVRYGCDVCAEEGDGEFVRIEQENLLNVHQLQQELIREKQTSLSFIDSQLTLHNTLNQNRLPAHLKQELAQIDAVFTRASTSLQQKRKEVEEKARNWFDKLQNETRDKSSAINQKRQVIERNYHLLSHALETIPIRILSCEEALLSSILMANSN